LWLGGPHRPVLESASVGNREDALAWANEYYAEAAMKPIAARVVLLVELIACIPIKQLAPQTRFLEDLRMDDLEPVELLFAVEEEFQIHDISEADAERLQTIDKLIRYLAEREKI
jgi:acyl carrier protein